VAAPRALGGALAVSAAALVLVAARVPAVHWGRPYAEDGALFAPQQLDTGGFKVLTVPYTGYLQLLPRVLVKLALATGIAHYPAALAAWCCVATAAVAGIVYLAARQFLSHGPAAVAFALITVLVPALNVEVIANGANIHWLCLWLAPWLFLVRPRTWTQSAGVAVIAAVVILTESQAILFLPLLLYRLRLRRRWPLYGAALAAAALQAVTALTGATRVTTNPGPVHWLRLVKSYLVDVGLGAWSRHVGPWHALTERLGAAAGLVGIAPFLAAFVLIAWAAWRARRRSPAAGRTAATAQNAPGQHRAAIVPSPGRPSPGHPTPRLLPAAAALAGSAILFAAALILNDRTGNYYRISSYAAGHAASRYAVVPAMFLLAVAVIAVDQWTALTARRTARTVGAAAAVIGLAVAAISFPGTDASRFDAGVPWTTSLAQARAACTADPAAPTATIDVSPKKWRATYPCWPFR
jgi:hypothetical protein